MRPHLPSNPSPSRTELTLTRTNIECTRKVINHPWLGVIQLPSKNASSNTELNYAIAHSLVPCPSLLTISSAFNLLLKVLFTFRSHYLFAIGLPWIFSFRWSLSPILSCIPKQLDSLKERHISNRTRVTDGILTLHDISFQRTYTHSDNSVTSNPKTTIRRFIRTPDYKLELCSLHSPLLRASLLVSFPSVIDMLKFTE